MSATGSPPIPRTSWVWRMASRPTLTAGASRANGWGVAPAKTPARDPGLTQQSRTSDVYLTYPRYNLTSNPNEIEVEHDPTIGVVSAAYASLPSGPLPTGPGIQADVALYAVSLVAVAALVGGTAVLESRRRRKAP